jgi:adenylate cyclase
MGGSDSTTPTNAEIGATVAAIKASRQFAGSQRLQTLLDYIVGETLKGAGDRLKEYSIAVDVFDRSSTFDPRVDSIVRVQASRLRGQLAAFYKKPPAGVQIRIEVPAGGYLPTFTRIEPGMPAPPPFAHDVVVDGEEPPVPTLSRPSSTPAKPGPAWAAAWAGRPWVMPAMLIAASIALIAVFAFMLTAPKPATDDPARGFAGARPSGPVIFVARYQLIAGPDYAGSLRDGLQIDLIDSLSRFPELTVLGYDTVIGQTGETARQDPQGADFIVTGSIQATGGELRVTSQLVHAGDNRVVWSDVEVAPLDDASGVLAVQSQIAGKVAGQLGQPHGVIQERLKEDLTEDRAISMKDYLCVLDSYEYSRAKSRAKHAEVRKCLEEVTTRSPRYAPAWAKLSWMYGDEVRYNFNTQPDSKTRALAAAQRAVEANSSSAMAHQYLAIAQFQSGDIEGFRRSIAMALQLNPNNAEILSDAAQMYILTGDAEKGRELADKAIAFNPGHPPWYHQPLAIYHIMKGDKAKALEEAREAAPDGAPIGSYILAAALRLNGLDAEADSVLRDMAQRFPDEITDASGLPELRAATMLPAEVTDRIFAK